VVDQPRVWGAVPLRNPGFVGRDEVLEQLRGRLIEPGAGSAVLPVALHGMGGVGKTQIVVEYVYRNLPDYDVIWWITSQLTTQIRASLVELAKELGVPVESNVDATERGVLEALRSGKPYSRWLLVFDNAEHPDIVRTFVPPGAGQIIVTSRNPGWAGLARTIEVAPFTRDESKRLLRTRHAAISDPDADRLADALGDLPLAVEQAASWRAQTGMPVREYVKLLEENSEELLKSGVASGSNYQLSVAAAWNVPLNRLRTERPEALALLRLCAFFGPEPISREVLAGMRPAQVPNALREVADSPIRRSEAIREISRFSLAKADQGDGTLQLHRLVQTVLRDQLDSAQQEIMRHAVHLMLVNADPGDPERRAGWPRYAALLPHVISSRAVGCHDASVRDLIRHLVRYLIAMGDYGSATQLAASALVSLDGTGDFEFLTMRHLHDRAVQRVGERGMTLDGVPTVFISYTQDSVDHEQQVRELGDLLEQCGVNVLADWGNLKSRADWTAWMTRCIAEADYILVIASTGYAKVGDGLASSSEHPSAQFEAALLRDLVIEDRTYWQAKMLPVLLPGKDKHHIPRFLQPNAGTRYPVTELTEDGIKDILRVISAG
jgi:hypothetical protein